MSDLNEPTTTEVEPQGRLDDTLKAELEAAVDSMSAGAGEEPDDDEDGAADADPPAPAKATPATADEGDEDQGDDDYEADDDDGLSEDILERAIRAGIPLKEAKQYPNERLLAAACDRIEGVSEGETGSRDGAGEGSDETSSVGEDDLLAAIPDLDPHDYDEKVVDGFKAMKKLLGRLLDENRELKGGQSRDWLSEKLDGVKNYTKGDPEKIESVRRKFDVLKAGYRAAGEDVSDEAVFSEASNLVLSAEIASAERTKKARAARRRSNQRVSRPTQRRAEHKVPDAKAEAAALVDAKYFGRR